MFRAEVVIIPHDARGVPRFLGPSRERALPARGLGGPDGDVVLGFRAEDAALVDGGKKQGAGGLIDAPVYALELLGDATMVTVRAGGTMVCVKAHKDYRAAIGDQVQIQLPVTACHLFNSKSETRISGGK